MRSVRGGGQNRILFSCSIRVHSRAGPAPASLSGVHTGRFKNCKVCRRGSAPGRDRIPNVRESGCAAMRRFGGSGRYRPGRGYCDILRIPGHGSARRYSSVECDGMRRFATPSPVARDGAPVAQCRGPGLPRVFRLTGSGGHGRLSSGTAAGSATLASHCFALGGIFFREPGRLPGAGARIRAG